MTNFNEKFRFVDEQKHSHSIICTRAKNSTYQDRARAVATRTHPPKPHPEQHKGSLTALADLPLLKHLYGFLSCKKLLASRKWIPLSFKDGVANAMGLWSCWGRSHTLNYVTNGMQSVQRTTKSSTWAAGTNQKLVQWWQMCPAPCTVLWHWRALRAMGERHIEQCGGAKSGLLNRQREGSVVSGKSSSVTTSPSRLHVMRLNPFHSPASEDMGTSDPSSVSGSRAKPSESLQAFLERAAWCTGREWSCRQLPDSCKALKKQNPNKLPVCKIGFTSYHAAIQASWLISLAATSVLSSTTSNIQWAPCIWMNEEIISAATLTLGA